MAVPRRLRKPTCTTLSKVAFSDQRALVLRSFLLPQCSSKAFQGVRGTPSIKGSSTSKECGFPEAYTPPTDGTQPL